MSEEELKWALQTYRDQQIADPDKYEPDNGDPDPNYGERMATELIKLVDQRED